MDDMSSESSVLNIRDGDKLLVCMPILGVREGRAPLLVVTAHRETGMITARIAMGALDDVSTRKRD